MGIENTEKYEITSQDLIFRGIHSSAVSDDKIYSLRLVKYINEAFFVWGECDANIKKLLKNRQKNEQKLVKLINELIVRSIAYKKSLFIEPTGYHLSTERVLRSPGLSLYNKRHNLLEGVQHTHTNAPATFFGQSSIYNLLYDTCSPIINIKELNKYSLTPLLFRIGEIFWNIDQLYMSLKELKNYQTVHLDALLNAVYEHFMYIGELSQSLNTSYNQKWAANTAAKKRELINTVKKLYETLRREDITLTHPTKKVEAASIIVKLKKMYKAQEGKELNKSERWYVDNIF